MMNIWGGFAKEWRISKSKINTTKIEEELDGLLDNVQKEIKKAITVPSALAEIFSDDEDDEDDDW